MPEKILSPRPFSIKICAVEGCEKQTKRDRVCRMHRARFTRNGHFHETLKVSRAKIEKCAAIDCGIVGATTRSFCKKHYQKFRKYGDANHIQQTRTYCSVDGCEKTVSALGYCNKHLWRFQNNGDPLISQIHPNDQPCYVEGCNVLAHNKGLCSKHYQRIRKHGTAEIPNEGIRPQQPLIYAIVCSVSNRWYIGSTIYLTGRKAKHLHRLRAKTHHNHELQKDFNFYGEDAFSFIILESVLKEDFLIEREQDWILKTERLYNVHRAWARGSNRKGGNNYR